MQTVVVLFNLKPDASVEQYEAWARAVDLPTVNGLPAVERFEVLRSSGLLSGAATAPYQYIELLRVESVAALKQDIGAMPAMAEVARQFREFADSPVFIVTDTL
jgi:hypothetical protein